MILFSTIRHSRFEEPESSKHETSFEVFLFSIHAGSGTVGIVHRAMKVGEGECWRRNQELQMIFYSREVYCKICTHRILCYSAIKKNNNISNLELTACKLLYAYLTIDFTSTAQIFGFLSFCLSLEEGSNNFNKTQWVQYQPFCYEFSFDNFVTLNEEEMKKNRIGSMTHEFCVVRKWIDRSDVRLWSVTENFVEISFSIGQFHFQIFLLVLRQMIFSNFLCK